MKLTDWQDYESVLRLRVTTRKTNLSKDGDGKPRVLVSSATFDATKAPKIAGQPLSVTVEVEGEKIKATR